MIGRRRKAELSVITMRSAAVEKVYDSPSEVTAEDGSVFVDGPDGVAVALTPEAAEETSDRLMEQAATANGQRRFKNLKHRPQQSREGE